LVSFFSLPPPNVSALNPLESVCSAKDVQALVWCF
jgi:hypothetical protein